MNGWMDVDEWVGGWVVGWIHGWLVGLIAKVYIGKIN